jgi:hypothetical protein
VKHSSELARHHTLQCGQATEAAPNAEFSVSIHTPCESSDACHAHTPWHVPHPHIQSELEAKADMSKPRNVLLYEAMCVILMNKNNDFISRMLVCSQNVSMLNACVNNG